MAEFCVKSSTPKKPTSKVTQQGKRPQIELGSDSSSDCELSYIDLDTGRIQSA